MDLKEYFKPNSEEKYQDQNNWQSTQLGHQIYSHNLNQFPEFKFCEIAFFNVREYEGSLNLTTDKECKIRSELYDLHFDKCPHLEKGQMSCVDIFNQCLMETLKCMSISSLPQPSGLDLFGLECYFIPMMKELRSG